jgi:adenylylsulfate kinase
MTQNRFTQQYDITQNDRCRLNRHASFVIWFTGLPSSGKSTLANELDKKLYAQGIRSYVLDGDNVRNGLNVDLGFSAEDRKENLRRIGAVSRLFMDAGTICIAALDEDRSRLKETIGRENFIEIYLNTPIEVCEARDIKGLYKKARKGLINNFTGVNDPYEPPANPDLMIDTSKESIRDSVEKIYSFISPKLLLTPQ